METDGENEPHPLTDQDFSILTQTPSQGVAVLLEMSMQWEDTHLQSTDAKTITPTLDQTTVIIVMDEDTTIHGRTTRLACPRGEIAETIIVITITDMRRSTIIIIIVTMVIIIMVTMIIMIIGPRGIQMSFTDVIT